MAGTLSGEFVRYEPNEREDGLLLELKNGQLITESTPFDKDSEQKWKDLLANSNPLALTFTMKSRETEEGLIESSSIFAVHFDETNINNQLLIRKGHLTFEIRDEGLPWMLQIGAMDGTLSMKANELIISKKNRALPFLKAFSILNPMEVIRNIRFATKESKEEGEADYLGFDSMTGFALITNGKLKISDPLTLNSSALLIKVDGSANLVQGTLDQEMLVRARAAGGLFTLTGVLLAPLTAGVSLVAAPLLGVITDRVATLRYRLVGPYESATRVLVEAKGSDDTDTPKSTENTAESTTEGAATPNGAAKEAPPIDTQGATPTLQEGVSGVSVNKSPEPATKSATTTRGIATESATAEDVIAATPTRGATGGATSPMPRGVGVLVGASLLVPEIEVKGEDLSP